MQKAIYINLKDFGSTIKEFSVSDNETKSKNTNVNNSENDIDFYTLLSHSCFWEEFDC